jgi:hypothetical protein
MGLKQKTMKEETIKNFMAHAYFQGVLDHVEGREGEASFNEWHKRNAGTFKSLLNSEQNAKECDATAAPSSEEPLAQKNPLEDITECYVPVSVEKEMPTTDKDVTIYVGKEYLTGTVMDYSNGQISFHRHGYHTHYYYKNQVKWLKKITLPAPQNKKI